MPTVRCDNCGHSVDVEDATKRYRLPYWIARMMGHTSVEMLFKKYNCYIPNLTHQDGAVFMQKFYEDGHFLDTCNKKGLRAKP